MLTVQVANAVSRMRKSDVQKPPGIAEAIDWVSALDLLGVETLDAESADQTLGSVLKYSEDQEVIRAQGLEGLIALEIGDVGVTDNGNAVVRGRRGLRGRGPRLSTCPRSSGAFSQRLHDAGMPVTPSQTQQYARALALTKPVSRRRLYWTTRAIFVTGFIQLPTFDRVFREVFGSSAKSDFEEDPEVELEPAPPKDESETTRTRTTTRISPTRARAAPT